MMNRKKIILALCVGVICVGVIIVLQKFSPQSQSIQESTESFRIDGLDDPKYLFSTETQTVITESIEQYLNKDNIKTGGISGIVRQDSYTKKEGYGANLVTLLVDIPEAKRTYKVSSSGSGDPDGDNSLYILCPSQDELIYGTFDCKDDVYE